MLLFLNKLPMAQSSFLVLPIRFGTPLKINMEHNNEGLEDVFPLQMDDFQVPC